MDKINLSTKKITEFTTDDTIYIRDNKNKQFPKMRLCKFISYEPGNRKVTGEIISVEENYANNLIGTTITAYLSDCALYGSIANDNSHPYYRWFDGSLYALHPLEEHKIIENELHVPIHPSYGLVGFSRRSSSGGQNLFGSSIQNKQTISLTINTAEHKRDINHDWYHYKDQLIEIEMSQTQLAELITSFNMGSGVPCTIRYIGRERMPDPPFISKVDTFKVEFASKMQHLGIDMQKQINVAVELLTNKTNLNKTDRETILNGIQKLMQEIKSNIPYVASQFAESMENTITQAKNEIEAFVENKIRHAGLEALGYTKNDMPTITNKSIENE